MATQTFVLGHVAIRELESRLKTADFRFNSLAYGHFSARGAGVVINAYRSGKVVVQGGEVEDAVARWLSDLGKPAKRASSEHLPTGALIGTDEAGKGDYFGPLVVAGVAVEEGREEELRALGVRDCKTLSDSKVNRLDAHIQHDFPFALVVQEPPEYNQTHQRVCNVNRMLAEAHAEVIATLRRRVPSLERVLVDRFATESLVENALRKRRVKATVFQAPRAEGHVAVAAASIVARATFLRSLAELGLIVDEELPKGGANAAVLRVGSRILRRDGMEGLAQVAKVHFKTTLSLEP